MNAHNTYISILVEYGLIGFVIFAIFLTATLIYSWKITGHKQERWLCLTLCVAWFIISIAKHTDAQKYTWVILALVWVMINIYKKGNEKVESKLATPNLINNYHNKKVVTE